MIETLTIVASFDALTPTASLTGPDAGEFRLTSDHCTGVALAPHATCTVQISFTAGSQLGPRSAALHLAQTASGPPVDVPLTARVATPASATPVAQVAPTLTGLSLTNNEFAVARAVTATTKGHRKKKPPAGTTIRFTLSAPATVQFVITQTAAGRRGPHGCVAPTRQLRRAKSCTRTLTFGQFNRGLQSGADRVSFSGRLSHGPLKPGTYILTATPTGLTHIPGRSHSIGFTIVKG
jgi:hypothetical protein